MPFDNLAAIGCHGRMENARLLDELFARSQIKLRRGAIFDAAPPPLDLAGLRKNERIEGMLLALAAGDSLGHSTEWKYDADTRHREFGTIVDHVGTALSLAGRISDDTQFSFWTVESLLAEGRFDFDALTRHFLARRERAVGMGRNTAAALARHSERLRTGMPALHQCAGDPAVDGRGNGSVMRLAPLLLPHLRAPSSELYADLALGAFLTHGHPAALAATVALGTMLWECLRRPVGEAAEPRWWLDEFVRIASDLEPWPPRYGPGKPPEPDALKQFEGCLWEFVDGPLRRMWQRGTSVRDACSLAGFGSGADCFQSVPAILYILMHHADSLVAAVIAAVNDTKDNDTVAAVVGAFTGALHGRRAIRHKWLDGISSKSLGDDSGSPDRVLIERLARRAAERFVGPTGSTASGQP
ncbi:MAG: ADP-ribosylglycohydrolase family protein [Pirellulaceae bacterium]|nr:ADP-ribosylglycohydrolase family protein [Pirellulaceae bacterium]